MSPGSTPPPGRLLVVDDETLLVTALLSTLRDQGYHATGATTPSDALAHLRREKFDVLLADLHLPEMDGIALLRAALEIDPALTGIVMTGHGSIDTAVDAMKTGAVDYVLKPFRLKTVLAIIERALATRRLREENAALNRRLAARTQELEAVNKELEAFSYSVSHDLRGPLRAIEGFTEALIEEAANGDKEQLAEYGVRIRRGVTRMSSMIDDLLGMAKAARLPVNRQPVNLAALARETLAKLQAQSPDRTVELVVPPAVPALGDEGLLRLAMENLLANAWKYTGRAEAPRVELGTLPRDDGLVYFVRDNGVGFNMAEADRLFTPFRRLSSGAQFEGTGIGLATVKRVVARHGGRIWAEAEPGKGATFFFTLPREEEPPATAGGARSPV